MQRQTAERGNDTGKIWGIIVITFILIIGLYYFNKIIWYDPPQPKEKTNTVTASEKKSAKKEDTSALDQKTPSSQNKDNINNIDNIANEQVSSSNDSSEESDNSISVGKIDIIDGELKESFEYIGKKKACEEILDGGTDGLYLKRFTDYYGGTINFEQEKSSYHYIKGKAVIDDANVKMHSIILDTRDHEMAYILMEIPYSIDCTKVSDDPLFSEFKKYENTVVGSGDCYTIVYLPNITIEDTNIIPGPFNFIEYHRFTTKEDADDYLKFEAGISSQSKRFDFD